MALPCSLKHQKNLPPLPAATLLTQGRCDRFQKGLELEALCFFIHQATPRFLTGVSSFALLAFSLIAASGSLMLGCF